MAGLPVNQQRQNARQENAVTNLIEDSKNTDAVYHDEAVRAVARIRARDGFTVADGVMRWDSNGAVPPAEWIDAAAVLLPEVDAARSHAVRNAELDAFLDEYREMRKRHGYSEETLAEIAQEFGDRPVVDVITRKRSR